MSTTIIASEDIENFYLKERSYRLLERLGGCHCRILKTEWVIGIVHRANSDPYIDELLEHRLVAVKVEASKSAKKRLMTVGGGKSTESGKEMKSYFVTPRGRDYLKAHPRWSR